MKIFALALIAILLLVARRLLRSRRRRGFIDTPEWNARANAYRWEKR